MPVFTEYGAIYRWADSVGVALDDLYGDFARWNLFVGDYHRDFGYPDADSMPEPAFIMPSEFPEILDGGGAAVYIDLADSYTGGAWATVEGGDSVSAVLYGIVPHGRTDTPDTSVDIFNINDTIPGVWRYDKLIAVVANLSSYYGWDADLGDFLYGPAPSATVELLGDVLDEPPYPNPYVRGESGSIRFPYAVKEDTRMLFAVWTSAGELVYQEEFEAVKGFHYSPSGSFSWEPLNEAGGQLAAGIYIYRLATENNSHKGKFAIINK